MATPNYKGPGQPSGSSAGWLGSLIGGSAPAYAGPGQPGSKASASFGSAPAYKPAPSASQDAMQATTDLNPCEGAQFAIVIPRQ